MFKYYYSKKLEDSTRNYRYVQVGNNWRKYNQYVDRDTNLNYLFDDAILIVESSIALPIKNAMEIENTNLKLHSIDFKDCFVIDYYFLPVSTTKSSIPAKEIQPINKFIQNESYFDSEVELLKNEINRALDSNNKELFLKLSKKLNALVLEI